MNERVKMVYGFCSDCKKLIEQGKPETEIKWKGFIPKYRIENKLDFDKEVE